MVSDTAGRTLRVLEETRDALARLPADLTRALQEIPTAVREATGPEIAALQIAVTQLDDAVRQATEAITTGVAAGAAVRHSADQADAPAQPSLFTVPAEPHRPASPGESASVGDGGHE